MLAVMLLTWFTSSNELSVASSLLTVLSATATHTYSAYALYVCVAVALGPVALLYWTVWHRCAIPSSTAVLQDQYSNTSSAYSVDAYSIYTVVLQILLPASACLCLPTGRHRQRICYTQ